MADQQKQGPLGRRNPLLSLMRLLGRFMPATPTGENERTVQMMHRLDVARSLLREGLWSWRGGRNRWPVTAGSYVVGDAAGAVAVCALTSADLMEPLARLPGVAIVGRVVTPNLGIEKIIWNVTTNRSIRFLLLCGKESPVFQPAQALQALFSNGITPTKRIIGAEGHLPVLKNISAARIEAFRRQVELVDCIGTAELDVLGEYVQNLAKRSPGPFTEEWQEDGGSIVAEPEAERRASFVQIKPGGQRQPLVYDPKGFFVITPDRVKGEIVLRHYYPDNAPGYEMRGRSAEPMLLGLLREHLISQYSHAGYLGSELAKAEAALRLGLYYEQDRPLRAGPLAQKPQA